jgi:glycosyl transferase family 25
MNTFLNCCEDLHLVGDWFCIDDNSSSEDREMMKKLYPFVNFYFKEEHERGHPRSMNIIKKYAQTVRADYVLHLEDDWKFFVRRPYISRCLDVLWSSSSFGQCLLNKNYGETSGDINIVGGLSLKTADLEQLYYLHEYCPTEESRTKFRQKYGDKPNSAYWPFFSLRPSLIRRKVFDTIGDFNENCAHFEMEYAERFKAKFASVFLPEINCLHIGRLTSERFDKTKLNAYDLNGQKQFEQPVTDVQPIVESVETVQPVERSEIKPIHPAIVVINLDHRPDRWNTFVKRATKAGLTEYHGMVDKSLSSTISKFIRYSAVDGKKLRKKEELQRLFEGNDYNMNVGIVGCTLSHINLYIKLLYNNLDYLCILEDDVEFVDNFSILLNTLVEKLPENWDLCYLGCHLAGEAKVYLQSRRNSENLVERWSTEKSLQLSPGGTFGYLVSKSGAEKLLDFIEQHSMTNAIDTIQQLSADSLNIYYPFYHLITSPCVLNNPDCDTDIQRERISLTMPFEERVRTELTYYSPFGTVYDVKTENDIIEHLNSDPESTLFYYGSEVENIVRKYNFSDSLFAYYIKGEGRIVGIICGIRKADCYYNRLKVGNRYSIDRLLNHGQYVVIPLNSYGLKHGNRLLPFNNMIGGSIEVIVDILKLAVQKGDNALIRYLEEQDDYILFDRSIDTCRKMFTNLRQLLKGEGSVLFVYYSDQIQNGQPFYDLIDFFVKRGLNVKILVVNALKIIDEKYTPRITIRELFPVNVDKLEKEIDETLHD